MQKINVTNNNNSKKYPPHQKNNNYNNNGGGLNYLRAHVHLIYRHAHHETKDWLPRLGSRDGEEKVLYNNNTRTRHFIPLNHVRSTYWLERPRVIARCAAVTRDPLRGCLRNANLNRDLKGTPLSNPTLLSGADI